MFTVKFLSEAETDLLKACAWYEDRQEGLGKKLSKEVIRTVQIISKNPHLFQVRFSEKFRFAPLKTFPYLIVFKIIESKKTVIVNAIFHCSRNPSTF